MDKGDGQVKLPKDLRPEIIEATVDGIVRAYDDNGRYYFEPDVGHNAMTLGQQINASICKNLHEDLTGMEKVDTKPRNNTIDVYVGLLTLRPAKLGSSGADDVWTSFPNSRTTAKRMALNNLYFTPPFDDPDFRGPRYFFIGHFGDQEGCQAIYLCAPAVKEGQNRLGWQLCVPIYLVDGAVLDVPTTKPEAPLEVFSDDDIEIFLKELSDEQDNSDDA